MRFFINTDNYYEYFFHPKQQDDLVHLIWVIQKMAKEKVGHDIKVDDGDEPDEDTE